MNYTYSIILSFLLFTSCSQQKSVNEENYLKIGGIEQWITIKGIDKKNPAILFIHGGPGSPMSPYSDTIFQNWHEDFTIIQWDQRGSGRTYKKNNPKQLTEEFLISNHLDLNQMVNDGIELTKFLIQHLGHEKIILIGESWGTVLSTKMLAKRPDLFSCYIGTSQIVNLSQSLSFGYDKAYQLAKKNQDSITQKKLDLLGKPPYSNGKTAGKLFKIIKKYERELSNPVPENWYKLSPSYDNDNDGKARMDGDDYSFFSLIGDLKLGVEGIGKNIDLMNIGADFRIPIYLFQGENDILCPKEINKPYFDSFEQSNKSFNIVNNTGHGITPEIMERQYKLLMEKYHK